MKPQNKEDKNKSITRSNSKTVLSTVKKTQDTNLTAKNTHKIKPQPKDNALVLHQFQDAQPQWKKEDFEILKQLGKGKFGFVYSAREKKSNYIVAIKRMCKQQLRKNNFDMRIKRQIQIQCYLKHKNILRMFGFFWDQTYIYLILQYAPGGELYKQLQFHKRLPEKKVADIIKQVCEGLIYLHSRNIIHRDIKPENLLMSFNKIKIADFGWSIHSHTKRETMCGTLDYLAPEMVQGYPHDRNVDIWAVGILCFELCIGYPPFETPSYDQTYERICENKIIFPEFISLQLKCFLSKLLIKESDCRMSLEQAITHKWITVNVTEQ